VSSRPAPGLVIAAPASGSGKTTVALALMRALARQNARVAPAKIGPDYIDPGFHAAACGRVSVNLDPWAMRAETRAALIAGLSRDADLIVAEGVMGLYDGAADGSGSTADLAIEAGWPVLLVLDVKGQAATAAAVVRGLAAHRRELRIAGVLFNRVGGPRHAEMLRAAMAAAGLGIPVLGCLPRGEGLALESRHLGLVQARERADLEALLTRAAAWIADHADLTEIQRAARRGTGFDTETDTIAAPLPPLGQRIAVARDLAFDFIYPHVLDGWRAAGAEILPFSPLAGDGPAADADAVYLPGGYPELHAGHLAAQRGFLEGLRAHAARGTPIFGECGGYMVLGDSLTDADGRTHAMAGLLRLSTSFAERRLHLGYRRIELRVGTPWPAGTRLRGHEFHYATVLQEAGTPLFRAADAQGTPLPDQGLTAGSVAGSFLHLIDRAG
jgi:cobyrinic acid a,c-diamide synthase